MAFQPRNQKEEPINKEDDIPAFLEKKSKQLNSHLTNLPNIICVVS